jgi:hypothetical protein
MANFDEITTLSELLRAEDVLEAEIVEASLLAARNRDLSVQIGEHFTEPINALSILHAVSNMIGKSQSFDTNKISLLTYMAWRDYICKIENDKIHAVRFSLYWLWTDFDLYFDPSFFLAENISWSYRDVSSISLKALLALKLADEKYDFFIQKEAHFADVFAFDWMEEHPEQVKHAKEFSRILISSSR